MRKPFMRKIIGALVVVGLLLVVGIALFWPWSAVFILGWLAGPSNYWTDCPKTLRGSVTSTETGLEAKLFHIQCPPPFTGVGDDSWYDFFALTFVKPGTDPSHYVTAMSANFGTDNSMLASWNPEMVWKDSDRFHIALPSSLEVWIREPSFAAWKRSGQLEITIPKFAILEIERVPESVVNRQMPSHAGPNDTSGP